MTIWEREPLRPGEPEPHSRVPRIAHTILLLMGLAALFAIGASASNYIRSVKSVHGLRLEIISLQVIDDNNPRAVIRFRLHNRSLLAVKIERYYFHLYLNGKRVGSSLNTYIGTDPNVDPAVYGKAANINEVLAPHQHLDLEFTLYVYSAEMEIVRRVQRSGSMSWSTNAIFCVIAPYTRKEHWVKLSARFKE